MVESQTGTTFGAGIICSACGARPWPTDPSIPESFDLIRTPGGWLCERHPERGPRAAAAAPSQSSNSTTLNSRAPNSTPAMARTRAKRRVHHL
jgi:hypothetical protein